MTSPSDTPPPPTPLEKYSGRMVFGCLAALALFIAVGWWMGDPPVTSQEHLIRTSAEISRARESLSATRYHSYLVQLKRFVDQAYDRSNRLHQQGRPMEAEAPPARLPRPLPAIPRALPVHPGG
jgi:hypothetical protein